MKEYRLFLICIFLSSIVVQAQDKDEQAVGNAVKRLHQGMLDANKTLMQELTSDKLTYGHSSWLIEDKEAFITAIVEGRSRFTSIDVTDQTISISGDVAIVRHRLSGDTNNIGQPPGHLNLGVLQIWRKENGRWLLLARQATRL